MKVFVTCPRCDEASDPDSTVYDDAFDPQTLNLAARFIRETADDPFCCIVCEAKGVYCEAEISEGGE
jgi:hypothetical protein